MLNSKLLIRKVCFILFVSLFMFSCDEKTKKAESVDELQIASSLYDLHFSEPEIDTMKSDLFEFKESFIENRKTELPNSISPKILFDPKPMGFELDKNQEKIDWGLSDNTDLPELEAEIAFLPVTQLASLIKSRKITSVELTKIYISRLKRYQDTLENVVTITEELAMQQAKKADEEIAAGKYRGPLHGIPYGVKDLFALEGYRTTWGATPYKDQLIDETATIIHKLNEAGAVLAAKLTLGALAMGDVWYGGVTKNPWDMNQGSSGSSAGSASSTAAGLVGFTIGTETWGSIVSPATRCGVTGLRPTFGRVSRAGGMALSWTMDKVGPICRTAEDCALVFEAIQGCDPLDEVTLDAPFNYNVNVDVSKFKVGYLKDLFEGDEYRSQENNLAAIEEFKKLGIRLEAVTLPQDIPVMSLAIILEAEAAAAFDELTQSNQDDELVAQHKYAWPNIFRKARFIPAVEYIQANRIRRVLIDELYKVTKEYDAIICPSFGGDQLLMTNLTGNPCVSIPDGFDKDGHPTSISIIGNLYDEATLLVLAKRFQDATNFDEKHPEYFYD